MTKAKTMMRGILTRSEILDYLTKEDVEEKIEALLKKDSEQRTECMEEFENVVESPLPKEEKERLMLEIMKDRISGQGTIEKEQRMAALR
ncbi:MAG: hypothetical protein LBT15_04870, partial [Synergistaceae bacterium]|nr:hypothetical protein [Synergistaceae bacterium]